MFRGERSLIIVPENRGGVFWVFFLGDASASCCISLRSDSLMVWSSFVGSIEVLLEVGHPFIIYMLE